MTLQGTATLGANPSCDSRHQRALQVTLVTGILVFVLVRCIHAYYQVPLLFGDTGGYVKWSYDLANYRTYPSQMPGYPFILALTRWLTLGLLPMAWIPYLVCLLAWVAGVMLAGEVFRKLAPETAPLGIAAYGAFPVFGLGWTNLAVADTFALTVFCAALLAALNRRWWWWAVITGLGLLIHQALYPFYFALGLVCLATARLPWPVFLASGVPFLAYYGFEAARTGNLNWMLHYHLHASVAPQGSLPVFEGVLGSFRTFSVMGWAKGLLLLSCASAAIALAISAMRRRDWLSLGIAVPVVMYAVVAKGAFDSELARWARLLVLPACFWLALHPGLLRQATRWWGLPAILAIGVLTELAWTAHIVRYMLSR